MGITKFIIIAHPRSGSTWLVDMLDSHPAIVSCSELFFSYAIKDKPTYSGEKDILLKQAYLRKSKGVFKRLRPFSCFRYLDYVYSYGKNVSAIGFKVIYGQLWHSPETLVYLLRHKVYVVHLIRSNILDLILSWDASRVRRVMHSFSDVGQFQVNLDTSNLLNRLKWADTKIKFAKLLFSNFRLPYIEVEYEKLLSKYSKFDDLLNFLGIERGKQKLETPLKKLRKGSHKEIIANYEEVKLILKGTKYYNFLNQ
jgi:LPS sulfotransferase NodH